jgi:hypothetical protein
METQSIITGARPDSPDVIRFEYWGGIIFHKFLGLMPLRPGDLNPSVQSMAR